MKAIKIKVPVNLTSGLSTPVNTILILAECYTNNKAKSNGIIPAQVATNLYLDAQSILDSKDPISGIADFNPVFLNLELSVTYFETKTAENLSIDAVYNQLVPIYTEKNLEIVSI